MLLSQLKNLLLFIQQAPEGIRRYLYSTFWVLVFLLFFWWILKILSSKEFRWFYRLIGLLAKKAGGVCKAVTTMAAKNIELPEKYPRLEKFFSIVFMVNGYFLSFLFVCFAYCLAVLLSLPNALNFWGRMVVMLFMALLFYFARFFFAQSEKDRIALQRK